jgi:repressor LexA
MGWTNSDLQDYQPTKRIPILGRISAGLPLYAEEQVEGTILADLKGDCEYFALRVKGDSMNAAHIFEGNILIVRKQDMVENGEIAVVMIDDNDATVKRFYCDHERVTLMPQSTNPQHQPQFYDASKTSVRVIGKVIKNQIEFE